MSEQKIPADTSNTIIVVSAVVSTVILVVMLVWLRSYFFATRNEFVREQNLAVENPKLQELHAQEEMELNSYGWVDRDSGVVRIPIDRAIELMVSESRSGSEGGEE